MRRRKQREKGGGSNEGKKDIWGERKKEEVYVNEKGETMGDKKT